MDTNIALELLNVAAEAASRCDERDYFVNLAASHVLDGITHNLELIWPEVDGSIIETVVAKATEALYAKLANGGTVRLPAGYLWGAANNQLLKLHEAGLAISESFDESLEAHNRDFFSTDDEDRPDREEMRDKAIRFARSVLPSLGQTTVVQVMGFIIDCFEQDEFYIDNQFIAQSLGLTADTVRKAKSRGFQRLQREAKRRGVNLNDEVEKAARMSTGPHNKEN
jgi:hypothetical protein